MHVKNNSNQLVLTRVYNFPVKLVWDAWVDSDKVSQWWGPRGFTLTTHSKDLKVGGQWIYTMHGPDGTDYPNITTYFIVEKYKRLEYDHGASPGKPPLFRVNVDFSEKDNKTTMVMTMTMKSPEEAQQIKKFIKQANGTSTWDRLAEYIESTENRTEKFIINRSFAAPIEKVFKMWTQQEHFTQWMGPAGTSTKILKGKISEGETIFLNMFDQNGNSILFSRFDFQKIQPHDLVIYTQEFCDKDEKPSKHPGEPLWPQIMKTTVQLSAESEQETRVTLTWEVIGQCSSAELKVFMESRSGMNAGWSGSFDRLEELLK